MTGLLQGKDSTFEPSFPLFSDLLSEGAGRLLGDYFNSIYIRYPGHKSMPFLLKVQKYQGKKYCC